jgi:serine/threonine protein kinase
VNEPDTIVPPPRVAGGWRLKHGDTLLNDRFTILALLGSGGMGEVYSAMEWNRDDVAIKLLRQDLAADSHLIEELRREVQLARKIAHVNVVRVHDLHESGSLQFITMEFVQGQTLRDLVRTRSCPSNVPAVFAQLAAAIEAVHRSGVVHGDIKPANVMLSHEGVLKLMDFGVARARDTLRQVPTPGVTPDYAAPEVQAGGKPTPASDIYLVGAVGFELLTGSLYSRGSFAAAELARVSQTWTALCEIVSRCLSPLPENRFADGAQLVAALTRALVEGNTAPPSPRSFGDLLSEGPAGAGVLNDLIRVADQLEYLHVERISHFVFSPARIALDPKVRFAGEGEPPATTLSPNPKYWDPLAGGNSAQLERKTEIYIFGFMVYEVFLGHRLMKEHFGAAPDWYAWHADRKAEAKPLRQLLQAFSAELSDEIAKCMRKQAEQRADSLAPLLAAFRREAERITKPQTVPSPAHAPDAKGESAATGGTKINRAWRRRVARCAAVAAGILLAGALYRFRPDLATVSPFLNPSARPGRVVTPGPAATVTSPLPKVDTATGEMVYVPGGAFTMGYDAGDSSETPAHRAEVKPFYIDTYEVSESRFHDAKSTANGLPATHMNWQEAESYCHAAGQRLPSEAEWEFAARGTRDVLFPWGTSWEPGAANIQGAAASRVPLQPSGSYPRDVSAFGVYDLLGNVPEWVADDYAPYPGAAGFANSTIPGKVVRGNGITDTAGESRLTVRRLVEPGATGLLGFRCAADPDLSKRR